MSSSAIPQKTPKMILNEEGSKKRYRVDWTTVEVSKPPCSNFKCICTVRNPNTGMEFRAEGTGGTKKEAEHQAARKILPKLFTVEQLQILGMVMAPGNGVMGGQQPAAQQGNQLGRQRTVIENFDDEPVSDTDDDLLIGEPIGDLITICRRNNLSEPTYEESSKRGPSNTNIFTVSCTVNDVKRVGRRFKKQDAKKIAAFRVVRNLKFQGYTLEKVKGSTAHATSPRSAASTDSAMEVSSTVTVASPSRGINTGEGFPAADSPLAQLAIMMEQFRNSSKGIRPGGSVASSSRCVEIAENMDTDRDEQKMEIDFSPIVDKLKRKLAESDDEAALSKRKYDPFNAAILKCDKQVEICSKLIIDYAHVFMHLPSIEYLENSSIPDKFQELLALHGGPMKLFKKSADDLNIKFRFGLRTQLNNGKSCIFLMMRCPLNMEEELRNQRIQVVHGTGNDPEDARQNAALEALRFLKLMISENNSSVRLML